MTLSTFFIHLSIREDSTPSERFLAGVSIGVTRLETENNSDLVSAHATVIGKVVRDHARRNDDPIQSAALEQDVGLSLGDHNGFSYQIGLDYA